MADGVEHAHAEIMVEDAAKNGEEKIDEGYIEDGAAETRRELSSICLQSRHFRIVQLRAATNVEQRQDEQDEEDDSNAAKPVEETTPEKEPCWKRQVVWIVVGERFDDISKRCAVSRQKFERIAAPRLKSPRVSIPAGSVGIGGSQTGVYPMASPGGWRLIGMTPVSFYDPNREKPVLCEAGDYIRFVPITPDEYERLKKEGGAS